MKQILIVMLLLAAAVLLGLLWLSPAPGDGPSQPAAPAATVEQPDAAAPVVADAPVSAPTPGAAVRKMRMPDGSELAPLNGLTEAPNPGWDPGVPYAAPVRVGPMRRASSGTCSPMAPRSAPTTSTAPT